MSFEFFDGRKEIPAKVALQMVRSLYEQIGEGIDYRSELAVIEESLRGRDTVAIIPLNQRRTFLSEMTPDQFRAQLDAEDRRRELA